MMRRAGALAVPTALLTSACGPTREWIPPSTAVAYWNDVPAPAAVVLPSQEEVGARWILPGSNPWAAYQKMTLIASLDSAQHLTDLPRVQELEVVLDAQRAAEAVSQAGLPDDAMWVVDLRGAASVAFGAALSASSPAPVAPVMTFNNWPAENEFVPAEETLAALVSMQPRLPPLTESGQPVFLLDAWRLAYHDEVPDEEVTDNRYMLTPADLPDPAVLLARGIHHVLYVVQSLQTTTTEEDDLHETFLAYARAGIVLSIVDLPWLQHLVDCPARWEEHLREQPLFIDPDRVTIVEDPLFYVRAHGGFGGLHVYGGNRGYGWSVGHGGG
jgi:hypothetical protein